MALLYGNGDLLETMTIACLAGWDADNNATTASGLLGIIYGFQDLPEPIRTATDLYHNEDVTGNLPEYQTVQEFALRSQRLAEAVIKQAGGEVKNGVYFMPTFVDTQ